VWGQSAWKRVKSNKGLTGVGGDIEHTLIFCAKAGQTFAWRCYKAHSGPVRKVVMAKPNGRQGELLIEPFKV
jgi:retron-type reverse transcriptase